MKKLAIISLSLISIFLASALVLAAGGSGGGNTNTNTQTNNNASNASSGVVTQTTDCEASTELRDRVKCRITTSVSVNSIEESCRILDGDKKIACVALQNRASPCYDEDATKKASCLRRTIGLGSGQLNRFADEDRREYAALLMYELQERIEKKHEQGQLTDEQSSELITSIIEIKQSLLKGDPIADIKVKMTAFKQSYLEAMN